MDWPDKLRWLEEHAHEVIVRINEHRGYYESIEDWFDTPRGAEDTDAETRARCIEAGRVVVVQVYPITPIGFYYVVDCDLPRAVLAAFDAVREEITTGRRTVKK